MPPLVANLDTRGLLQAVLGGVQDRVADLRSYAARYPELIEPDPPAYAVVLASYLAEPGGNTVQAPLDVDSTTPEDEAGLPAWAAAQLGIEESRVSAAVMGTDALREVGVDTVQLLAQSLGAVLYPGLPGEDAATVTARQRQALSSYFPRLRLKGTAKSFEVLARLAGFDDGAMIPLWTRLSPRAPGDLGAEANGLDFRAKADILPTGALPDPEGVYDPQEFTDGPFYPWASGTLSADPASPDFYLTAVNGKNPFLRLSTDGSTVSHPGAGVYVLTGGAPGRAASASLEQGTRSSHLVAMALTEGGAFNGLRLTVSGTGSWRSMAAEAQLSTLKYRSSAFDLALFKADAGTRAVTVNSDLAANPALRPDGVATAPFRPWAAGTNATSVVALWPSRTVYATGAVRPRTQAAGTVSEIDAEALVGDGQRVYDLADEVRAATRFPRRTAVGLSARDNFQLAAYPCAAVLVVTTGTGSYGGIVAQSYRPAGVYRSAFAIEAPPAIPLTLTTQSVAAGTFNFAGPGISGSYFGETGLWRAGVVAGFTAGTLTAHWSGLAGDGLRPEPSDAAKLAGSVCYQSVPEGTVFDSDWNYQTWDDVPWLRPLRSGGESVDANMFLPFNGDPDPVVQEFQEARVMTAAGAPARALVYDFPEVAEPPFLKLREEDLSAPVTIALAGSGTSLYPVVAVSPTTIVAEATWNRGRYDDALLWWPLSEQPFQPLAPVPALGLAPDVALISPSDRVWDGERGWALRISSGTVARADVGLPDQYSFALTAKTSLPASGPAGPAVRVGAASVHFGASTATLVVQDEAAGARTASVQMSPGTNALVYVAVGTGTSLIGVGDSTGWRAEARVLARPARGWSGAQLSAGPVPTQVHDFMVWSGTRTTMQLDSIRAPRMVAAKVPCQRPYVGSVGGDRWALQALQSAFVVPVRASASPEVYPEGDVRRYEGTGRYAGNPAYKQVGLGGSQTIPATWRLGSTGPAVPAIGKVVVSGTHGEPGINSWWAGSFGTLYAVTAPYGGTGGLTVVSAVVSGSVNDWPPALAQYNPAYDRVYLRGDTGYAYEVRIDDLGNGPVFVASIPLRPRPERELPFVAPNLRGGREVVTDFETALRTDTYEVSVNSSGTVYAESNPSFGFLTAEDGFYLLTEAEQRFILEGEFGTTPFYLYLNSRVKSWATSAFSRWVNRSAYGEGLGVAALETAGEMLFENSDPLPAGNYRLSIDAGNVGTVDSQFAGFDVEVLVTTGVGEPISFPVVLLPNGAGTDPRGWTRVEFTLPYGVVGAWRLSLRWTNDRDVPSRGEFRRLAVYAYTMRRVASELHRIIALPLTITPVDVSAPPLAAGAYAASFNSYGTISGYEHEQNIYPETAGSDTFNNPRSPLADALTGSTLERRDRLDIGSTHVPADPIAPPGPTAGALAVSPVRPYYNVGDVLTLSNVGATCSGAPRRVWHLWDSGTRSTWEGVLGGVTVNKGGTLGLSVEVVDDRGASAIATAAIVANWPPSIQLATGAPTFAPVPFSTSLSAVVADPDGDSFAVSWWRRVSAGSQYKIGDGLSLSYVVAETQTVRAYAIDARGGTNFADVPLTAGINAAPSASIVAISPKKLKAFPSSATASIPPAQKLQIAAVARDPEGRGVSPLWRFWDGSATAGAATRMVSFGGGTFCSVEKLFSPAYADRPGTRGFSLTVTDGDGLSSVVNGDVELVENLVPVVTELSVSAVGVKEGTPLYYSAVAYDPDGDEIGYVWEFPALNLVLFGPNVSIDTTGLAGRTVGGTLKVSDDYGGQTVVDVPSAAVYTAGLAPLAFSPAGGLTSQGVVVEITSPDLPSADIVVRYTLDGSDPVTADAGNLYSGPVMLPYATGTSVPVNARAFKDGQAPTALASATFVFSS